MTAAALLLSVSPNEFAYVAGTSSLGKFNASFTQIWLYSKSGVQVTSVALDNNGNSYAGFNDGFVRKIDRSGSLIWETDTGEERVEAVAVSATGEVAVKGFTAGQGSNPGTYTLYYLNSSGVEQWNVVSGFKEVAFDSAGDLFDVRDDDNIYKLNKTDGSLLQTITASDSLADFTRIVISSNDDIYVAGSAATAGLGRYNASGTEQWLINVASVAGLPTNSSPQSIAVDGEGNVIVGDSASSGNIRYVTKFDVNGSHEWNASINEATGQAINGVGVSQRGIVYAVRNQTIYTFSRDGVALNNSSISVGSATDLAIGV